MKKIFLLVAIILFVSCSSSDDIVIPAEQIGFANTPVSGTIYGANFTYVGGYATSSISNGVQKLFIKLDPTNIDCSDAPYSTPLRFSTPQVVGLNTTNVNMTFESTTDDSFVSVSGGIEVEIISIGATVKGKVKGASITENCSVNGTFEVPFCN